MITLADISDLLTKVLGSSIGPIPFFAFPALALGIGVAVWFLKANVKKEVTIDPSKGSSLMTAEEWLKRQNHSEDESSGTQPSQPTEDANGKADLEERLIGALAQAPWKVKEGSEIALAKNESTSKWGIATNKITFVLGGNEEIAPQPTEPEPPLPEAQEQSE